MKLLLVLMSVAYAQGPSFGLVGGDTKNIAIGDYGLHNQQKPSWDLSRYGGGVTRIQGGQGLGISAVGNSGVMLNDEVSTDFVHPRISLGLGEGRFVANTNRDIETFYHYHPNVGIGPQFMVGKYSAFFMVRGGPTISNLGYDGLGPHFNMASGPGLHIGKDKYGIVYMKSTFDNKHIEDLEFHASMFMLKYEKHTGRKEEKSYLLLLRFDKF